MPSPACPPSTPSVCLLALVPIRAGIPEGTNQSLHCSVQSMSVVSSELRVGAVEGWISGSLGLLDAVSVGFLRLAAQKSISLHLERVAGPRRLQNREKGLRTYAETNS